MLMRMTTLAILALAIRACSTQDQSKYRTEWPSLSPQDVAGCYVLSLTEWKPNLNYGRDIVFATPPHRIQLATEKGTVGFEASHYLLRPAPGETGSIHRASWWD